MTTDDPAGLVGTVIEGRFEVVSILGRGGNGVVCEVRDRTTQQPAALKMLVGDDPTLAARLEREGKALALLSHPNIVALVDTGTLASGSPYVVTELIRGRSLRDQLDWDTVEPQRALAIMGQVLDALAHAHAARVIHRDIKPDNIMLVDGYRETVKLIDFGVAKALDAHGSPLGDAPLTRAGVEVLGSPAYIAPEGAIGEPVDQRADLYSAGIVLFEMLAGRVPFHAQDSTTLLRMHVGDPLPPLGRPFPREVELAVKVALAKDPANRFGTAADMHTSIDAALAALAPAAAPVAQARPRRTALVAGALILLVIVWLLAR